MGLFALVVIPLILAVRNRERQEIPKQKHSLLQESRAQLAPTRIASTTRSYKNREHNSLLQESRAQLAPTEKMWSSIRLRRTHHQRGGRHP